MSFIKHVLSYFKKEEQPEKATQAVEKKSYRTIGLDAIAYAKSPEEDSHSTQKVSPFTLPVPMPGVLPENHNGMAMDNALIGNYAFAAQNTIFNEGIMALPYAYLAELSQRPEYRNACDIISKEMTREWITLHSTGEDDLTDDIKAIEAEIDRVDLRGSVRDALRLDCEFGRSHLYVDLYTVDTEDYEELDMPLRLVPAKIPKDSLKGFKLVEPMWTYPNNYDSARPLADTYYKPQSWFVMGNSVHASRLITFVTRPVPDLLKPAYQFGGMSLIQMMKPYVDNWLRTRQSVSDLVRSFSVMGIKTTMSQNLDAGAMQMLQRRIIMFNAHRDNRALMVMDKDTEEFFNASVPLTTLDALQAQSQEQMCAVTRIPISIFTGITPSGLNASTAGENENFAKMIGGDQESIGDQLKYALDIIQLSKLGKINPSITFTFNPLFTLSEKELAEVRKLEAETDQVNIDAGIIDSEEARLRLANQEDSPYHGLDPNKVIEPVDDGISDDDLLNPAKDDDKEE